MKGEPLNILYVEDDDDHAEMTIRGLEEHHVGNLITRLSDGEAALDYLFRRSPYADAERFPRPHVVLLDLRLPRVDGLEVLKAIRADPELKRVPVVVLTTSDHERDIARAYDLHVNAYLVKPVEFGKFLDLMRDLGFFWLVWNRGPA
ncbi:MAG: response regulator [Archangiaceae bacterium]|nr:response regulator [Archangiaceae bacterium]